MLHEMQHYKDALEYRKNVGEISEMTYGEYLNYLDKKYRIKLQKLGIDETNVKNISEYAGVKYIDKQYDEVYAEYIVKSLLTRK